MYSYMRLGDLIGEMIMVWEEASSVSKSLTFRSFAVGRAALKRPFELVEIGASSVPFLGGRGLWSRTREHC